MILLQPWICLVASPICSLKKERVGMTCHYQKILPAVQDNKDFPSELFTGGLVYFVLNN